MKAVFISFVLATALCACGSTAPDARAEAAHEPAPTVVHGEHTAQNSLDYHGVYKAADMHGAFVEVELAPGGTYRLRDAEGNVKSGLYRWDSSGRVVTLLGSATPDLSFFVGENRLWLGVAPHSGRLFVKQSH